MDHPHTPILVTDILTGLDPTASDVVYDGTIGFGGHAETILPHLGQTGRYIGIDRDPAAIAYSQKRLGRHPHLHLIHGTYTDVFASYQTHKLPPPTKILLDLGLSSYQLDHESRGFSFQTLAPLDMRMNPSDPLSAADILNTASEATLTQLFQQYTDLHSIHRLVSSIQTAQPTIHTTVDLVNLIKKSMYFRGQRRRYINACSQVFQALRIAVNHELDHLNKVLQLLPQQIQSPVRIAILSFHSIEDRLVKQYVKQSPFATAITKRPLRPAQTEIRQNSRAKSAKLRLFTLSPSGLDLPLHTPSLSNG